MPSLPVTQNRDRRRPERPGQAARPLLGLAAGLALLLAVGTPVGHGQILDGVLTGPQATETGPAQPIEPGSLDDVLGREPKCAEASNGCAICRRSGEGGPAACSTPGIACQPAGWRCERQDEPVGRGVLRP